MEWHKGPYRTTDDPAAIDLPLVASFLAAAYWPPGIPAETVERAIANSLCLSVFHAEEQVGFARIVTDSATFAYLCDVFVVNDHRREGLGHWIAELAVGHPAVEGVRVYLLGTNDAHAIYRTVGFTSLARPEALMEIRRDPVELYQAGDQQRAQRHE